jgi:SAM-dependent methyltransferase
MLADVDPDAPVLEVGCGTGRATVPLARRGRSVLALEPNPAMTAVAARNLAPYPAVRIEGTSFEDWPVGGAPFGLLVAAPAWHWVSPAARVRKAADALTPGGVVALCWNRPQCSPDDPVRAALDTTYERLAPDLHARLPRRPRRCHWPARVDH